MVDTHTVFLGLGSNVGDRLGWIKFAVAFLLSKEKITSLESSSVYQTSPVGCSEQQNDYYNSVVRIDTGYSPYELLDIIAECDRLSGRERPYRWAPRELDIDILLYDDISLDTDDLIIPHPRMMKRAFVLVPLFELSPELNFFENNKVKDIIASFSDDQIIKQIYSKDHFDKYISEAKNESN